MKTFEVTPITHVENDSEGQHFEKFYIEADYFTYSYSTAACLVEFVVDGTKEAAAVCPADKCIIREVEKNPFK